MVHSVASGGVGRLASRNKSHAASLYLLSYYFGSSILGPLGGWFWREGGWAAVVAFCSTLMMIVLGIAAKLRRGRGLFASRRPLPSSGRSKPPHRVRPKRPAPAQSRGP